MEEFPWMPILPPSWNWWPFFFCSLGVRSRSHGQKKLWYGCSFGLHTHSVWEHQIVHLNSLLSFKPDYKYFIKWVERDVFQKEELLKTLSCQLYFPLLWASWGHAILYPHQKWRLKQWSHSDGAKQARGQKQKPQALSGFHCPISMSYEWYPLSQKNYFRNVWPADHEFPLNKNKYDSRVSILSDISYLQKEWKLTMVKNYHFSWCSNNE